MNTKVILGLWPIAGITSGITSDVDNRATIEAAHGAGVRWFDTAFSYGYDGESDRLLGEFLADLERRSPAERSHCGVIGKVGQRWTTDRQREVDSSPKTLRADAETSLRRLRIDCFDLLMLHSVDPQVDIQESAAAMVELQQTGMTRKIGVCNIDLAQLTAFNEVKQADAIQIPLNLLQQENLTHLIPFCHKLGIEVHVYWTLMKGILAGKISENHQFGEGDSRSRYEIYRGEYRTRTHQIVGQLVSIASEHRLTVAELSIGWTLSQPGVTAAIVGAKYPAQIEETATSRPLSADILAKVDTVLGFSGEQSIN
jgi:aryl-alcohol dehydrogenase-like predicted oxidoreductase